MSANDRLMSWIGRYPPLLYALRGAQMRLQALAGRPDGPPEGPLRRDRARFESLFASSLHNFDALLRPRRSELDWPVGRTNNGTFEAVDTELYHAVLREYRPRLVIEVGGGHSSTFSTEALRMNGRGRVIVIDPSPRARLPPTVEHLAARVEAVDLALFARLAPEDVLFIDSSHTTEEARYHVDEILPRLAPGVFIQHHDFLFPYVSHYRGDAVRYGETDVLLEFYLRHRDRYEVVVGAAHAVHRDHALVSELVPSRRWQPRRIPGSLWVRKR